MTKNEATALYRRILATYGDWYWMLIPREVIADLLRCSKVLTAEELREIRPTLRLVKAG